MADRVDDDLGVSRLVEDQIGIWRRHQPSDERIDGLHADAGVSRKQIDGPLNAVLHTHDAARRVL